MVTLSFTIFSRQKNHNRAHMLFQYLSGFEPILYTTHTNEEPEILEKTREMLDDMTQKGFVDSDISKKIRECFGGIY